MTTVKIELPDSLAKEAQQPSGKRSGRKALGKHIQDIEAAVQAYRREHRLASGA